VAGELLLPRYKHSLARLPRFSSAETKKKTTINETLEKTPTNKQTKIKNKQAKHKEKTHKNNNFHAPITFIIIEISIGNKTVTILNIIVYLLYQAYYFNFSVMR